jgi:hypothetical protein
MMTTPELMLAFSHLYQWGITQHLRKNFEGENKPKS